MKKEICRIFEQNGLSITTNVNSKTVDFLDITLDLNTGVYKPYMKENDHPLVCESGQQPPPKGTEEHPHGGEQKAEQDFLE